MPTGLDRRREALTTAATPVLARSQDRARYDGLKALPSVALLHAALRDGWIPLVLALVFDANAPPSPRDRPAADILKAVIGGV